MTHHTKHSGSLFQGLLIFVFLAFLTAVEFFIAITNASVLLLSIAAILKVGLVLYYYMHVYKLLEEDDEHDHSSYAWKLATNRLGLWLFLLSDAFVFGGMFVARFNLLGFTRPHLSQELGLIVTSALLVSSFFMNRGETQMAQGDRRGFFISTSITLLLGLAFLLGVVFVEWPQAAREGLTVDGSAAGGIFYLMTGMHAFHVFTGLIFLLVVLNNARKGVYSAERHWGVEAAAVYWHFVDLVWIFFYPALYLIGKAL